MNKTSFSSSTNILNNCIKKLSKIISILANYSKHHLSLKSLKKIVKMTTSSVIYKGNLRTICTHLDSGNQIITDAPKDNSGNGEAFSPTDLAATSLATCMLTVMGIKAKEMDIDLKSTKAEVTKIMVSDPRRIGAINVKIHFPELEEFEDEKNRIIFQRIALNCPVYHSLHPDIEKNIEFIF